MNKTSSLHIRVSPEIKKESEKLFNSMGLSTADAVNLFLYQSVNSQAIPFPIKAKTPNAETVSAMAEVEEMIKTGSGKSYKNADELLKALGK